MAQDWNSIATASQAAFGEAVNEWIGKARIRGGQVNGSAATLSPGSLFSDVNIEAAMLQSLSAARIPAAISGVLAKELSGAWNAWAAGFYLHLPNAYPRFAAFPGPVAPPTPTPLGAIPVAQGSSAGETPLKATVLARTLGTALRNAKSAGAGSMDQAMNGLATWVEGSFVQWRSRATLVGLMGRGPVPNFAAPYVPVGPVIKGDNISAGPVFAGPSFGLV